MFHRLNWLWLVTAVPVVAVVGIVTADIVRSFDTPEPQAETASGKKLPPCCCQNGCELPTGLLPQGAGTGAQPQTPLTQATLGGGPSRNMVNLVDKNAPTSWVVVEGKKQENVKWVANLGKLTYGGPTVYGGRVFVGTNNQEPRDPKIPASEAKAVLMCFDAKDGKF